VTDVLKTFEVDLKGFGISEATIPAYLSIARRFLESSGGEISRQALASWLSEIRDRWKPSSVNQAYYVVKRLFEAVGAGDEVPRFRLKGIDETITRRVVDKDTIKRMIEATDDPTLRAYLAISTTYGLRRGELAALSKDNFEDGTFVFKTEKGGLIRRHTIPEEIEFVREYHFSPKPPNTLGGMFKAILQRAGISLGRGYGWHSVRAALVSGLVEEGVDAIVIHKFMGWKSGGVLTMPLVYTRLEAGDIDRIVFSKHPFLKLWSSS